MLDAATATVTFTVPGKPSAWQRARKFGKHHFTLPAMAAAQAAIAAAADGAIREPFGPDYAGAVEIEIVAVFEIPKSRRRGKHALAPGDAHLQKPDASNISKQVEDALNGVAYHDDAQVCGGSYRKVWGERNETRVTISAPQPADLFGSAGTWKSIGEAARDLVEKMTR